jgi:colanic acid biosynthesis glycosyl transferase WcaI
MQIIFLNRFFYPDHSATSQMLSDLAFFLADAGHEVAVITSRQRYDDPAAGLPSEETVRGVRIHRVRTPRFGRGNLAGRALDYLGFYVAATRRLRLILSPGDIVVAKTDPPLISIPAAWVARQKKARLVNWLQDVFPEVAMALGIRGLAGPTGRLLRSLRNWSLCQASMNVVIGERMRDRLLAAGIPQDKVTVIPNWADGEAIRPMAPEDNPLRREWGLDGKFVVGYSGNLGRAHEYETILGAAEQLRNDPRIAFLFIGGGAQMVRVREIARARGVDNIVSQPYQPRERLNLSLGAADVHLVVLRPELEGLIVPSKAYGCLAAGRPIIFVGDAEGEIARVLRSAGAGIDCPVGDQTRLATIIREMTGPGGADQARFSARQLFDGGYDLSLSCARFAEVFAALYDARTSGSFAGVRHA